MPYPASPPLASPVQVEISFENPVVFAGQSLNAIITFKNPLEPPIEPLGKSKERQEPTLTEKNGSDTSAMASVTKTRPTRAMSERRTSPYLGPLHGGATLDNIMSPPATPTAEKAPGLIAQEGTMPPPQIKVDSQLLSNDELSPVSPEVQPSGFWELPGRRVSNQLANSLRELYWSNSSTPDIADASPGVRPASSSSLVPNGDRRDEPLYQNQSLSRWGSRGNRPLQHQLTRSGSTYLQPKRSQTTHGLLMGYAQLQGYFVLDEELIEVDGFAHVKTQGVVVGPSGGIGYGSQNGSGLLQGLASGLGSLLQIRDNDGNSSSEGFVRSSSPGISRSNSRLLRNTQKKDSIPIFSTPQSLLFVDLKLSPGETRSFSYRIELPKALPPSCRAKSIRIYYNLVIGIQKLDSRGRPQPKTTLVPFRVFPHVDKYGQQYTHDLKTPIVLQKDQASVVQLPPDRYMTSDQVSKYIAAKSTKPLNEVSEGKSGFSAYIGGLLNGDDSTKNKLLSQQHSPEESPTSPTTSQDNIEYFSRYQYTTNPKQALKSRFDIGRSGKRIATVSLSKPVSKVGDNIVFVVDYANADLKCYRITASLETEEFISPDVLKHDGRALSAADTSSMTRRVYSQSSMSTYSLSRSTFEFTIPATATPQFSTSDIALKWNLKLDFITSPTPTTVTTDEAKVPVGGFDHEAVVAARPDPSLQQAQDHHQRPTHNRRRSILPKSLPPLFVDFANDSKSPVHVVHINDQGLIAAVKENIPCESFHCKIPLTVMPTNQDISALLEHTVSATRTINM